MRVLTPQSASAGDPALVEAARVLDDGGVVALPTETVYGLACRAAFPKAIERIYDIKRRPREKRLPFLLPDVSRLTDFMNTPPRRALRLAARWWPGPLTLVLGDESDSIAVRVPDSPATRTVLSLASGPVHGTSANISGADAALDAESVVRAFLHGAAPDVVIDGGRCRVARESTLVRMTAQGNASILRRGALSHDDLLPAATVRILIVCSGNTCRSPMAAFMLREALAASLQTDVIALDRVGLVVESAGTSAIDGAPASSGAMGVARRRGTSLTQHRSRFVGSLDLGTYDRVFGLTAEHASALRSRFGIPFATTLDPRGLSIPDPFGGTDADYDEVASAILVALEQRVPELSALAFRPNVSDRAP